MATLFCKKALLHTGWADDVRLSIDDGRISGVDTGAVASAGDALADCVIPGVPNAHSHAFQRALAGRTEERSPADQDNFWTWRERMYELAGSMTAERLKSIARQAYIEMLESGYTSVAEFHYLHTEPGSDDTERMFDALHDAATDAGIRMTYVPVLYERAGFDRPEPEGSQRLFAKSLDEFLQHHARVCKAESDTLQVAIGAHSIRAVSPESLAGIASAAAANHSVIHIHVAEQQLEVEQALASYKRRPVRWLLENFDIDERWCLVHATHMEADETAELAQTGAVVCLCPSTEANLGDGLFPLNDYLTHDGKIAIGSDSHVSLNPFEELRWLEYGQRLITRTRNVAAVSDPHVGRELFARACAGGARACGRNGNGIRAGGVADLVCLYGDDPMLLGHDDGSRLDALVFSGYHLPIDRVMVAGQWRVRDGRHVHRDRSRRAYGKVMRELREQA